MVCIYENPLPRLKIADVEQTAPFLVLADNQHICRTETRRRDVAVVDPLLHQHQRLTAIALHLLDDGDNELSVYIGDLVDFLGVPLVRLRPGHLLMQVLLHLVLTDAVGECAFLGI